MSDAETEKMLAEMEAQQAAMDAALLEMGVDIDGEFDEAEQWKDYPDIVRVAFDAKDDTLEAELLALIGKGADVNAQSPHGETALRQCFARSAFGAFRLLLDHGADFSEFGWSDPFLTIARGDVPDLSGNREALLERSGAGRSLFLQACRFGNLEAAKLLEPVTPAEGKLGVPDGDGPVMEAAASRSPEMLDWLLAQGYSVNEEDRFGGTALLEATVMDDAAMVKRLLQRGADPYKGRNSNLQYRSRDKSNDSVFLKAADLMMGAVEKLMPDQLSFADMLDTPASVAHGAEVIGLLVQHGCPLDAFDREQTTAIIGAERLPARDVSADMFRLQSVPREGTANPERVDVAFWHEQIRTGRSGYSGEVDCTGKKDYQSETGPVWSFDRFGRTGTRLPDGRWVLVAGEHEDHYDPDFYIYNDVTVIHPDARMEHYIYPRDVFPPTDFHTATLLDDHILLIGNLGYPEARQIGQTQVLRLELSDFSIRQIKTTGQNPGWISRHSAVRADNAILVSGGKIEPEYKDSGGSFALDLATMVWSRVN